jgi:hypothetical protein
MVVVSSVEDIEKWFTERPAWIQDALSRLLQKGSLDESDIPELVSICKSEVGILEPEHRALEPRKPVSISIRVAPNRSALRVLSVFNLQGINALAPRKPLELGNAPLTVVYGLNASGKSGYIRVFKHASGQRNPGPLLADVFSEDTGEQSCKFRCEIEGATKELHWIFSNGPLDELQGLQVYDSNCGAIYINEENEATYEPFALRLFTQLTEACVRVNTALNAEIVGNPSRKPAMPPALLTTPSAIWYGKIGRGTTASEVDEHCRWLDEFETELTTLNQRLTEPNPTGKARELRRLKDRLVAFGRELEILGETLSDDRCGAYLIALSDSRAKTKAADDYASVIFANAPLEGIGSESWKLLWQQARAYSQQYAYKDSVFPNTEEGSRCVLCQEPLSMEAKQRLVSFESFVRSGLEAQATAASASLGQLYAGFGGIPTADALNLRMDSLVVTAESERVAVHSYRQLLEGRKAALLSVDEASHLPSAPSATAMQILKTRADQLEVHATSLDLDASGQDRPLLEARRDDLVARKWLSQQRSSIDQEVGRLKFVHQLQEAQRLTGTLALSTKKSSLTDRLITEAFVERFQRELEQLGAGRIKVKLMKARAERGRVYHEIRLTDPTKAVPASDVLSEGEFRIVSLAAFLADVEVRGDNCPFIFDDPISSLDHVFEDATAQRLVELSKSRQVIVFTHRLSLLEYIEGAAKNAEIAPPTVISLRREHWGLGEPGEPVMSEINPQAGLDHLLKRLDEARSALEQFGRAKYEELARGICGDLRILFERIIEKILLSGVITRHNREVHTKNKLAALAKITSEDCALFDDFMTRYSTHEHSQPEETPIALPGPDEIANDVKSVKAWIVTFKKRV